MSCNIPLVKGELTSIPLDQRLLTELAVKTVASTGKKALILDGSSRLNPYHAVRACKRYGIDEKRTLKMIMGARGFTAYQMCELIEMLKDELIGGDYSYLGISGLYDRFLDPELEPEEGRWLLQRNLRKLKLLVKEYELYSVVSAPGDEHG